MAAVTALVFMLLGAGDLFGLRACPHHEPNGTAGAHGDLHHQTAPGTDHAHYEGAHGPAPDTEHQPCTCTGYCPTGAAPSMPPVPGLATADPDVQVAEAGLTGSNRAPRSRFTPFFLPYSQAPPVVN